MGTSIEKIDRGRLEVLLVENGDGFMNRRLGRQVEDYMVWVERRGEHSSGGTRCVQGPESSESRMLENGRLSRERLYRDRKTASRLVVGVR